MEIGSRQWSIADVARSAGISSRTLRHYDAIGLLKPAGTASNGHRVYGDSEILRLQQILAFKELGVALADICAILDSGADPVARLEQVSVEFAERIDRLRRQRDSIQRALDIYRSGGELLPAEIFDGFDHTEHQQEVEERWGKQAYASGDRWWRSMSEAERSDWQSASKELASAWADAGTRAIDPSSMEAQELAARQARWLSEIPGTPGASTGQSESAYLLGLSEMYVADERFAANYGGKRGAELVAAALRVFVDRRDGTNGA